MSAPAEFAVWAPLPEQVRLQVDGAVHEMRRDDEGGWWRAQVQATPDSDYGFLLDDTETPRPDPRSRRQPDGVHGLSRRFDPDAYEWGDRAWTGRPLAGGVVYELHVGTFTPEGTFDAAIGRLGHLVRLGVDFVELLPVNAFNGTHNWGYDGVLWYAVQETYGGPAAYQRFVDACHQQGLGVIQDVVYNHLGPSGNYLPEFFPIFAEGGANTWGNSINLSGPDSDEVRRYVIDNALMWLRDMHVDGLRLDAVHALVDERATHVLEEMAQEVDKLSVSVGRPLTLIAESDLNDPRMVTPRVAGGTGPDRPVERRLPPRAARDPDRRGPGLLRRLRRRRARRPRQGADRRLLPRRHVVQLPAPAPRPAGRHRGLPGWKFLGYLQDHDQIGNRAVGDRISATLSPGLLAVGADAGPDQPVHPDAVHGRGVGREHPVAVLHQPPGAGAGKQWTIYFGVSYYFGN